MGIYRGTGGTGDSTTDTTVTTVTEKAAEAASSATSAANSATSAANSASSASTSATNAATSATNSATSASNASTSETNAATSASQAATSATNSASSATASASSASSASTSATNAATSATAAQTAETNAETAETNAETAYANTLAIFGNATDVQNAVDDAEKLAINPEDSQYTLSDAVTTGYSALHYAAKAEDYKTAAEVSKNAAETAETAAETAQGLAETAKTAAETAQSAAETAQAAAELAQSNAETVYDNFDDRYLGNKSGDPLVDNDNDGLTTGTLYFNTTENEMRVYTGTAWVAVQELSGDQTVNSLTSNNNVVVKGNLEVQGTTITVDSATAQTIDLGDNDKIRLGDSDDLQIYHDGSNSYVSDQGTGNLYLQGTAGVVLESATGDNYLYGLSGGEVALYHNNSIKAKTTSTGVDITGNITVSGTVDGRDIAADGTTLDAVASTYVDVSGDTMTGDLAFGDNVKAKFGASDDLQIFHDGSHSYIKEVGTGNLRFDADNWYVRSADGSEAKIAAITNGAVSLYYDGTVKLATTSSGVDITGTVVADGLTVDGTNQIQFNSGKTAYVTGNPSPFIYRTGTSSGSEPFDAFGNLVIQARSNAAADVYVVTGITPANRLKIEDTGDISFYEDTGTTAKLTWDASAEELQFKDNVKAEFGDSGGLTIRHSGTQAYIENNTGTLHLINNANDNDVLIMSDDGSGGTAAYFRADGNVGEAILYHYGSQKLATKSTGIDVTGTVTADGLTVENDADTTINFGNAVDANDGTTINVRKGAFTSSKIQFLRTNDQYNDFEIKVADNEDVLLTYGQGNISNDLWVRRSSSLTPVLRLKDSGDISFYDDAGTSQDFYWDASLSRLGLGTTTPSEALHIQTTYSEILSDGTNNTSSTLVAGVSVKANNYRKAGFTIYDELDNEDFFIGRPYASTNQFVISNDTTDRLRINNAGDFILYADDGISQDFYWDASTSRLGLGTTSPTVPLHINAGTAETAALFESTDNTARIQIKDNGGFANIAVGNGNLFLQADQGNAQVNSRIEFDVDGSEVARFDSSGRLGIGTTSPDSLFHISSGGPKITITDTTYNTDATITVNDAGALLFSADANNERFNSRIQFDVDGSEKVRIDQSGNVGIGTTSPTQHLEISGSGAQWARVVSTDASGAGLKLRSGGTYDMNIQDDLGILKFSRGSTEQMRIDSSGNVGIGTTSPAQLLHLQGADTGLILDDTDGTSTHQQTWLKSDNGNFRLQTRNSSNTFVSNDYLVQKGASGATSHEWRIDNSEAARIDSSGNLLVGTTANDVGSSSSVEGITLSSGSFGGYISAARSGGTVARLNRQTSDGQILDFRKDGTTVGSIGVSQGSALYIVDSSSGGIRFGASNEIIPCQNNGLRVDNTVNLGQASYRWKDLYLSGGISNPNASGTLTFSTAGSEAARFDSSGNLLVGTTSTLPGFGNTNEGISLRDGSHVLISRSTTSGNSALYVNKNTSDGNLVAFSKDGTTIGSIGTFNSHIYIGTGDTGIRFTSGDDALLPINAGSGATRTGSIDLGRGYSTFKNLYLSGGVYLGGTGSANLLDDYEEGTWTPSLSNVVTGPSAGASATYSGTYVKIGSIVHCTFTINLDDSANAVTVDDRFYIANGNLPFLPASPSFTPVGNFMIYFSLSSGNNAFGELSVSNALSGVLMCYITHVDGSLNYDRVLQGEFTYETSA